jgi:hypothetical protein
MKIKTKYIIALLGIVWASPAFSASAKANDQYVGADSTSEPSYRIQLDVYEQNQMVYCQFRTEFKCKAYAIQGKQAIGDAFTTLFYCNDELCVDSREWVDISFLNNEEGYQYFRIKTELSGGDVRYSQVQFVHGKQVNEVELVNTVVTNHLYFRYNEARHADAYYCTISGLNGETVKSDIPANEGSISLGNLPAGFYIISFKSLEGTIYRYKFFKASNL